MTSSPFTRDQGLLFKALVRDWHTAQTQTMTMVYTIDPSSMPARNDLFVELETFYRCGHASHAIRQSFFNALLDFLAFPAPRMLNIPFWGLSGEGFLVKPCMPSSSDDSWRYIFHWPGSHHQRLQAIEWADA